jgi:PAS domain S-box-containing protein
VTEDALPARPVSAPPPGGGDDPLSPLFDMSPFPAVVSRLRDHRVLAINQRASEVVGIGQADAVGVPVTDFYVDPAERTRLADELRRDRRAENFRIRIKRASGEPLWVIASSRLVEWQREPAVLTVFHDIDEQLAAEASLKASERRLVAQSDALTELTARYANPDELFEDRLRSILEISARALDVGRLSMWRFDEARSSIRCMGLHRVGPDTHESGAVLRREDAPRYFGALERERVIAAVDAPMDPRTGEFTDTYLVPHGIGAMLDVPLRHDNATVGVLCA